jgi:hypothetical protein
MWIPSGIVAYVHPAGSLVAIALLGDRTTQGGVEQGSREASVHGTHRVEQVLPRFGLERRAPFADLGQVKSERPADGGSGKVWSRII